MWSSLYWRDLAERALKTAAQSTAALLVTSDGVGVGLLAVDWPAGLALVGSATLLSVLTSLASVPIGDRDGASLTVGIVEK